jgi:hypothetical protein
MSEEPIVVTINPFTNTASNVDSFNIILLYSSTRVKRLFVANEAVSLGCSATAVTRPTITS